MSAGWDWLKQNVGMVRPPPSPLTLARPRDDDQLQAEIIAFDSEAAEGQAFLVAAPGANGLSAYTDVGWPRGLDPQAGASRRGMSLPKCDVLIVTWTVEEGHALARVLTPGHDSQQDPSKLRSVDWKPYRKNFDSIAAHMTNPFAPARHYGWLGTYWTAKIGSKRVTLFKSDSHMSQDGLELANELVWKQIIEDCQPELVITTGTGGGIGSQLIVGDVIVSQYLTFDCQRKFKALDSLSYRSAGRLPKGKFQTAERLFATNAGKLPGTNRRPPKIKVAGSKRTGIATTDFFGFDTSNDYYKLQGHGALSEMGDAVLGKVCGALGADAPDYVGVRNVSDPQIEAEGSIREQAAVAANIYKAYGRWSSVCSAVVCWAIVAGLA
jgi:nucleoside phosphorylase